MKTKTQKKWVFVLAKQGLSKHGILKTNLVSNWRGPVEKKEGEKKRKRKIRWRSQDQGQKGMELGFLV